MPELEGLKLHRSSETELVRAVTAGDQAAYGVLYDRLAPLVRAVCHDHMQSLTAMIAGSVLRQAS